MEKERRSYTRDFKIMAVELVESGKTPKQVGIDLDISRDLVCRWRREMKGSNKVYFSGNGNANLNEEQKEIIRLQKELREAKLESEILKKAVSIFSKSDGKF